MNRWSQLCLLVCGIALVNGVQACSIDGEWPTTMELAESSSLVFVAHVTKVGALSDADEKFMRDWPSNTETGKIYTMPAAPAEFELVKSLKGDVPLPSRLASSSMNCSGIALEAGRDYLIFARMPERREDAIRPLKGSFELRQDVPASQQEMRNVEVLLTFGTSSSQ